MNFITHVKDYYLFIYPTKQLCILVPAPFILIYGTLFASISVVQKMLFGTISAPTFFLIVPEADHLMVLFGTNILSNISTKASKKEPYSMPNFDL